MGWFVNWNYQEADIKTIKTKERPLLGNLAVRSSKKSPGKETGLGIWDVWRFWFFFNPNNDLFISSKRKNPILEMALKSFIISKLDDQMSKSWKWNTEKLSAWLLSSGQDFGKSYLNSKHVLKVCFKPKAFKMVSR